MIKTIRLWSGGFDHCDDRLGWSSHNGVLSFCGVAVGYCYHSALTARHQYVLSNDDTYEGGVKVRAALKKREYGLTGNLPLLINHMLTAPKMHLRGVMGPVLYFIKQTNSMLNMLGCPARYRTGAAYVGTDDHSKAAADVQQRLTVILYENRDRGQYPYLVRAQCQQDVEAIEAAPHWRMLDDWWWGTHSETEYVLFAIGCTKSLMFKLDLEQEIRRDDVMRKASNDPRKAQGTAG